MELVLELGAWLDAQDAALVALGSGDAQLETGFRELAATHPDRLPCASATTTGWRIASRPELGSVPDALAL